MEADNEEKQHLERIDESLGGIERDMETADILFQNQKLDTSFNP